MAKIVQEDLWKEADIHFVTANSDIKKDGSLVMGAGAAKQAAERYTGLEKLAGAMVKKNSLYNPETDRWVRKNGVMVPPWGLLYGLIVVRYFSPIVPRIGLFQTKFAWREKASPTLIEYSINLLRRYAETVELQHIRLNYPGIGAGHLDRAEIEPLLAVLPDNVTICFQ